MILGILASQVLPIPKEYNINTNNIPFQLWDGWQMAPYDIASKSFTISNVDGATRSLTFSAINITGSGLYENFDPNVEGMYAYFFSGSGQKVLNGSVTAPGAFGYSFSVSLSGTFTTSYSQAEWNLFATEKQKATSWVYLGTSGTHNEVFSITYEGAACRTSATILTNLTTAKPPALYYKDHVIRVSHAYYVGDVPNPCTTFYYKAT